MQYSLVVTKSQIDKLGDRLTKGRAQESDLRNLDQYRQSFAVPYGLVIRLLREDLGLTPTGRPAKSTTSISEKLKRETIRLTQIQDIAGCRIIVSDLDDQNRVVERLRASFDHVTVVDRRQNPSHGYRAVHVILTVEEKAMEVQIRTPLQHLWAELSEKLSDIIDPSIKYGGGSDATRAVLDRTTAAAATSEDHEQRMARLVEAASSMESVTPEQKAEIHALRNEVREGKEELMKALQQTIAEVMRSTAHGDEQ